MKRIGSDSLNSEILERFKNEIVYWYTDNFAGSLIVSKGSNKEKLQELALNDFEITLAFNIKLSVFWIP